MATLPSVDKLSYSTPAAGGNRALMSGEDPVGRSMEQFGATITTMADKQQEEDSRIDQAYAESDFLTGQIEAINELRDSPDYENSKSQYATRMKELASRAGSMIKDPAARRMWLAQQRPSIARGMGQVMSDARVKRIGAGQARSRELNDRMGKAYLDAPDEATRATILDATNRRWQSEQKDGIWQPEEMYTTRRAWMDDTLGVNGRAGLDIEGGNIPAFGGEGTGSFDDSYQVVAEFEGGPTKGNDGASGHPAIMGINRRWHADEYAEAKRLWDSGDMASAKSYAKEFYRKNYWDGFDIESLPPGVRDVALDAAVNHRQEFARDLIAQAKMGAGRQQLIDMRMAEYERLNAVEKKDEQGNVTRPYAESMKSWTRRLNRLNQGGSSYLAHLSPQEYARVKAKAQAYEGVQIRKEATEIEQAWSLGMPVPAATIESLASRADKAALPEAAAELRKYGAVQDKATAFAGTSTVDMTGDLAQMREKIKGGDTSLVDEYDAKLKIYTKKAEMIGKGQGWEYYQARGVVPEQEAINLADPSDVAAKVDMRRVDMAQIRQIEGDNFSMSLFKDAEIDQIKDAYEKGSPEQAATVLAAVAGPLNAEERYALSRQIAPKSSILAAAMNLDPRVAAGTLAGSKITIETTDADLKAAIGQRLTGVIGDGVSYDAAMDATVAYYKHLALQNNKATDAVVNEKLLQKAQEDVVGDVLDITARGSFADETNRPTGGFATPGAAYAGSKASIGLPSRVLSYRKANGQMATAEDIEDILGGITDEKLKKAHGKLPVVANGDFISAREIVRRAQWRSAGDGLYIAHYPGLGVIRNPDGTEYVFNARKLEQ